MKENPRTVGVVLLAVRKEEDKLQILVQKRASEISFGGLWCLPCGHLEYNETGEEAAVRETYEEMGILFDKEKLTLIETDTNPNIYNQNVILRYKTTSQGQYINKVNDAEVSDWKWLNISELDNYNWAFNHKNIIKKLLK